jgi:anti-sigma-K factor RskA
MTCAEVEELIELYVIGALPPEEAREVALHLDSCTGCRDLERHAAEVAQVLRLGVVQVEPSPTLRTRVAAAVRATPVASRGASGRRSPWRVIADWVVPGHPVRLVATLAIAPLLLSGWLAFQVMQLRSAMESTETALINSWETSQEAAAIMGKAMERGGSMVSLQGMEMSPEASGMLYYMPSENEGVLVVRGLPGLNKGNVYQCWLVSGERRVSGGTFYPEGDGRALLVVKSPMPLESVDAVGVTQERHGGSPEPAGQRYVWGRLRRV